MKKIKYQTDCEANLTRPQCRNCFVQTFYIFLLDVTEPAHQAFC